MIFVALFCLVFGLWVLLKDITKNLNLTFFIFSWSIVIWAIDRYAFYNDPSSAFLFRGIYATASLALLTSGPWILYLIKERPNKLLISYYYLAALVIFSAPLWDHYTMGNPVIKHGVIHYSITFPYYIYISVVFLSVFYIFSLLVKELTKLSVNKDYHWYQLLYVSVGYFVFFITEFIYGFVLTAFNLGPSAPIDYFSSVVFIAFAAYALVKLDQPSAVPQINDPKN